MSKGWAEAGSELPFDDWGSPRGHFLPPASKSYSKTVEEAAKKKKKKHVKKAKPSKQMQDTLNPDQRLNRVKAKH